MRRLVMFVVGLALLAGVAAGVSGGETRAETRWVITDLGTLDGEDSAAQAINKRGQIIGESKTKSGDRHAFLWVNGKMRDLGTLGGRLQPGARYQRARPGRRI